VKKPVNFGFLDLSTLENRRYFSEREVILNRRLCPRIYLGVVPISLNAGRLVFGPGDEVVEYAVKMRKLQNRYFMLRLLKRDQVRAEDLDRVVSTLKIFYEALAPAPFHSPIGDAAWAAGVTVVFEYDRNCSLILWNS
jgi:aminoglycoside phosphotransferase family enzyme